MHYSNTVDYVCLIGSITSGKPNTQEFDLTKLINQKEIDYLINSKLLKHFVEEAVRLFNIPISCPVTLVVEIIIAAIYWDCEMGTIILNLKTRNPRVREFRWLV